MGDGCRRVTSKRLAGSQASFGCNSARWSKRLWMTIYLVGGFITLGSFVGNLQPWSLVDKAWEKRGTSKDKW